MRGAKSNKPQLHSDFNNVYLQFIYKTDALAAVTALAKQVKSLIASVKKLTKAVAKLK